MKKDFGKLLLALLGMAMILTGTVFGGNKLSSLLKGDTAISESKSISFEADVDSAKELKAAAEVLKKRAYGFGANDAYTTIEGCTITLVYTGDVDAETLATNIVRHGELTFRNTSDEQLATADALYETQRLGIMKNEDQNYLVFYVDDSSKGMATVYSSLLVSSDNTMVVWLDYAETQKYETEKEKDSPAYIIAASTSSSITSTFYISVDKTIEELRVIVALVNSGVLECNLTPVESKSIEPAYGTAAINNIVIGLWATIALVAIALVVKYRLNGLVNTIILLGVVVASVLSMSLLGVLVHVTTYLEVAVFVVIGAIAMALENKAMIKELATGRNPKASFDNSIKNVIGGVIEGYAIGIVVSALVYVSTNNYVKEYALTSLVLTIASLIFVGGWNYVMLNDLISSNYFDKVAFGYSEHEEKHIAFNKIFNKVLAIVLVVIALIGAVYFAINTTETSVVLYTLLGLGIAVLIIAIYAGIFKVKHGAAIYTCVLIASTLFGFATLVFDGNADKHIGLVVIYVAIALALSSITLRMLNQEYKTIVKNKLSLEKIETVYTTTVNKVATTTLIYSVLGLVVAGVVYIALLGCMVTFVKTAILVLVMILIGVGLTATIWHENTIYQFNNPTKKKVRKLNEVTETTIYGINEMH